MRQNGTLYLSLAAVRIVRIRFNVLLGYLAVVLMQVDDVRFGFTNTERVCVNPQGHRLIVANNPFQTKSRGFPPASLYFAMNSSSPESMRDRQSDAVPSQHKIK
jgi:hypothetical protein